MRFYVIHQDGLNSFDLLCWIIPSSFTSSIYNQNSPKLAQYFSDFQNSKMIFTCQQALMLAATKKRDQLRNVTLASKHLYTFSNRTSTLNIVGTNGKFEGVSFKLLTNGGIRLCRQILRAGGTTRVEDRQISPRRHLLND